MDNEPAPQIRHGGVSLAIYWAVVGIPLLWGIWKTAIKLPALFQ